VRYGNWAAEWQLQAGYKVGAKAGQKYRFLWPCRGGGWKFLSKNKKKGGECGAKNTAFGLFMKAERLTRLGEGG